MRRESQLGAIPVLDSCTGATANLPLAGYFSDAAYAKQHASNLAAFRAALLKAQSDGSMSAPLQGALTKYDHLGVQAASLLTLGTYPTSLQEPDLQRVANLMFTFNAEPTGQRAPWWSRRWSTTTTGPGQPVRSRAPGQRSRAPRQLILLRPSSRAMSMRCTSEVPSPISRTFASR